MVPFACNTAISKNPSPLKSPDVIDVVANPEPPADHVRHAPAGHCAMLSALEDHHFPPELILLNGPSELIGEWLALSRDGYKPWRHSFAIPNDGRAIPAQAGPPLAPPYLPRMMSAEDRARPIAYVCSGLSCSLPIKNVDALKKALAAR